MQSGGHDGARVAIVTGASSGIGEASAAALAKSGFRVVAVARRGNRLEALAKRSSLEGGEILPLAVDLGSESDTSRVALRTLDAFGRIDVLVNNAGFSPAAAIEQLTREEIRRTFEVNLFAGLQLVAAVVPRMRDQGGGRIINMGSLAGSVPAPLAVTYSATKAALSAATRGLRLELAPWKIHVSHIVPGFVDTPVFDTSREMGQALREDESNPYRQLMFDLDDFAQAQLEKALRPEDIAAVVVEAATARRPRERYYAPFSAGLQERILRALPERWVDRMLLRLYKVPSP